MSGDILGDVLRELAARRGHFLLESGHHGDLWLELEQLCVRPAAVRRMAAGLAERLAPHRVEAVCGPLVEGAFVALLVAEALNVPFTYTERFPDPEAAGLYPVRYRLPEPLRGEVRGKRVAIVNDVVNAGSAVRGTFVDLGGCGAETVVLATLLVLGSSAATFAAANRIALETLASLPNEIWAPGDCPLCARGVPLDAMPATSGGTRAAPG